MNANSLGGSMLKLSPDNPPKKIRAGSRNSISKMNETNDIPAIGGVHEGQDDTLRILIVGGGIAGLATVSLYLDHCQTT